MAGFQFTAPGRTIFGRGTRQGAAAEIAAMGTRVALVRGRSVPWVDVLADELRGHGCAVDTVFAMGEPTADHVDSAALQARDFRAQVIVAIGGGAVIDLGKALAGLCPSPGTIRDYLGLDGAPARSLSAPLAFAAIPTTSGTGAEATRNAVIGLPERQIKLSLRDARLLPALALIDPGLTDDLPRALTLATGMDAVTQLIESYLCNRPNIMSDALCASMIGPGLAALRQLMVAPEAAARDTLSRASHLSGLALANSGLGVVHGLASVIGGRGGAHGAICGRLLPSALGVNAAAMAQRGLHAARFDQVDLWIAQALGAKPGQGAAALQGFIDEHDLPQLGDLNLAEPDYMHVAAQAQGASSSKANPVALSQAEILAILHGAG
ncbi:MAG: iron-containing alcohol dehydrogenase [Sulfitobacter sp.]